MEGLSEEQWQWRNQGKSSPAKPPRNCLKKCVRLPVGMGVTFKTVLEDAMRDYIASKTQENVRPEVMAHYGASVERNRLLAELLSQ